MKRKIIELSKGITTDPSIRFGRPVIRGTRVPADVIVGRIASGMSAQAVAEEYEITEKDVFNALRYAAKRLTEENIWVTAG